MDSLKNNLLRVIWAASALAPISSFASVAPDIDCGTPLNHSEQAICGSPRLMKLDGNLSTAMQRVQDPDTLVPTPADWASDRARCNGNEHCLVALYTVRIEDVTLAAAPAPSGRAEEADSDAAAPNAPAPSAVFVVPMIVIALLLVTIRAVWVWMTDIGGRCPKCKTWRARRHTDTEEDAPRTRYRHVSQDDVHKDRLGRTIKTVMRQAQEAYTVVPFVTFYECIACSHAWARSGEYKG